MDINKTLEMAPSKIAEMASKMEESRFLWQMEKEKLKMIEARTHLELKANTPDLTVSDLKASVDIDDTVYKARVDLLIFESTMRKEDIELNKWKDAWTSARKLASIKIQEMQSLNDTMRGNNG